MRRDVPAADRNFNGEVVTGAGEAVSKPMKIIVGNGLKTLIASNVGPMESGINFIIPGGWWLRDY